MKRAIAFVLDWRRRSLEYSALGVTAANQRAFEQGALAMAQAGMQPADLFDAGRQFARDGRVRL